MKEQFWVRTWFAQHHQRLKSHTEILLYQNSRLYNGQQSEYTSYLHNTQTQSHMPALRADQGVWLHRCTFTMCEQ
jgi:hypothetical protein